LPGAAAFLFFGHLYEVLSLTAMTINYKRLVVFFFTFLVVHVLMHIAPPLMRGNPLAQAVVGYSFPVWVLPIAIAVSLLPNETKKSA
jgi:hypothetical protein